MSVAEQFQLAVQFMILGMSVVFVFLTFLIFVVKWMGLIIQKLEPAAQPQADARGSTSANSDVVASVIGAAIHQYQKERR